MASALIHIVYSIIAVTNKHTAKLDHVGSLYIYYIYIIIIIINISRRCSIECYRPWYHTALGIVAFFSLNI